MKKAILVIYLSHLTFLIFGQTTKPFPYLLEITHADDSTVHLYVDKHKTEIFNQKLSELNKNHPLYTSEDCESGMTLLAITSIDNSSRKYAIVYGFCPEPEFHLYSASDLSKFYGAVGGVNMYIPGNGSLYVSGHLNSNFDRKVKLKFENNELKEVKQPLYYVGLKTKTLKPITLYQTKEFKNVVANLPENYRVEVLLAETGYRHEDYYLIKTDFGLVGWAKIKAGQYSAIDIEGIYFNGD